MAPTSPRTGLRSPPPSSDPISPPPRSSQNARNAGIPSITPRRFRRFFTPRTRLSPRLSASRRALHDLGGSRLNHGPRYHTPSSSPLKPLPELIAGDDAFSTPGRPAKRRRMADTPPLSSPVGLQSSPLVLQSSPAMRASKSTIEDLLSPLGPLANIDSDDDMDFGHLPPPRPEPVPPVKPITPITRRGFAAQRLQRELGTMPINGRRTFQYPVADYQSETADFCSTPDQVHTNISHDAPSGNCIPFCTTGCNTNSLVAIGDEEGRIRLLDSNEPPENGGFDKIHLSFRAHSNAIIDLDFCSDDSLLATASGDQTGRVIDMMTQTPISQLSHHTASLKQVKFQPGRGDNSVLTTSSRDGSIQIWDLRCKGGPVTDFAQERQSTLGFGAPRQISPGCVVNSIYDAHLKAYRPSFINQPASLDTPNRGEGAMGAGAQRIGEVSVTSLQFMHPGKEHLLISGCEADASIKLWDIRSIHTSRQKTMAASPLSYTTPPDSHVQWRPYGIGSLALSGDGARLYALCKDSTVYAYSTAHLMLGYAPELGAEAPRRRHVTTDETLGPMYGFRHESFHAGSFYVKCAVRPAKAGKGEVLAVGSSAGAPVLFPTDEMWMKEDWEGKKLDVQRQQQQEEEEDGVADDVPKLSFDGKEPASAAAGLLRSRGRGMGRTGPVTLMRSNSMSSLNGASRPVDTIPICQNGTALVRGHSVEVGAVAWSDEGKLVSVGDDYLVRCWGEDRDEAKALRTLGEGGGRRWNSGWADVSGDYDEEY